MLEQIEKWLSIFSSVSDIILYALLFLSAIVRLDRKGKLSKYIKRVISLVSRVNRIKTDKTAVIQELEDEVNGKPSKRSNRCN